MVKGDACVYLRMCFLLTHTMMLHRDTEMPQISFTLSPNQIAMVAVGAAVAYTLFRMSRMERFLDAVVTKAKQQQQQQHHYPSPPRIQHYAPPPPHMQTQAQPETHAVYAQQQPSQQQPQPFMAASQLYGGQQPQQPQQQPQQQQDDQQPGAQGQGPREPRKLGSDTGITASVNLSRLSAANQRSSAAGALF